MEQRKVLIQLNNASFRYPSEEYLFEDLKLTIQEGDVVALVGVNGSGKSTLLKLMTGKLPLTEGTQEIKCRPYYVPQVDLSIQQGEMKIYEYISQYYEEWWDVATDLEKMFQLILDFEADAKTLSGGELMKLNLVIALMHEPDVLVLDEPTNHLDIKSISTLIEFIKTSQSKYTFVIVSHDVFFLNSVVNKIYELENKELTAYGGNYDFYKEQKALHLRGLQKQYELAKEKLEKTLAQEQKEIEKKAKRANQAKRAFIEGSITKRQFNDKKDAGQTSMKNTAIALERLKDEAADVLEDSETEDRHLAFINLKNTKDNLNRTIFELENAEVTIGDFKLIKEINLKITYGDRIVVSGNNGSGKTSFVKALMNKAKTGAHGSHADEDLETKPELSGEVSIANNIEWVYLDQHYSLIDPELSLIENLIAYNPEMTKDKAKEQLGKFQFKTDFEMNKPGNNLSGGEMVRVIMAMVTSFPIDMIILDEPTNNLDVETVAVLKKALNNFRGAVVVISHNIDFLNSIKIDTAYLIQDQKLKLMKVSPQNPEAFYSALIS